MTRTELRDVLGLPWVSPVSPVCMYVCMVYVRSVAATVFELRTWNFAHTFIHTDRQKGETGETRGKPKYVAELRTGQYTVQVCEIVQFSD